MSVVFQVFLLHKCFVHLQRSFDIEHHKSKCFLVERRDTAVLFVGQQNLLATTFELPIKDFLHINFKKLSLFSKVLAFLHLLESENITFELRASRRMLVYN